MASETPQARSRAAWELTRRQHGVVTHAQLRQLGRTAAAIRHRLKSGRLHRLMRGVYAVGRPSVSQRGRWMAAVLACGPSALLSHRSAAALWGIRRARELTVEVTVAAGLPRARPGIQAHRRAGLDRGSQRVVDAIPVTDPVVTLVDLAACPAILTGQLEAAINEADHLNLVDPEHLLATIETLPRWPGRGRLRQLLRGPVLTLTSTQLERRFLPLAEDAGLPPPRTQLWLDGHRVDFHWPELGLVVEADSLRYHRTPFRQARDKRRDNAHTEAGRITLRFTHGQICSEPGYVRTTLANTVRRLTAQRRG